MQHRDDVVAAPRRMASAKLPCGVKAIWDTRDFSSPPRNRQVDRRAGDETICDERRHLPPAAQQG
jgi:hypothetical protein